MCSWMFIDVRNAFVIFLFGRFLYSLWDCRSLSDQLLVQFSLQGVSTAVFCESWPKHKTVSVDLNVSLIYFLGKNICAPPLINNYVNFHFACRITERDKERDRQQIANTITLKHAVLLKPEYCKGRRWRQITTESVKIVENLGDVVFYNSHHKDVMDYRSINAFHIYICYHCYLRFQQILCAQKAERQSVMPSPLGEKLSHLFYRNDICSCEVQML